jgi:predicted Zn-dependent protease
MRFLSRLLAVLSFATLAACGTTPLGVVADVEAEQRLGDALTPAFLQSNGGLYEDARIESYLTEIAGRLSPGARLDEAFLPIRVQVLDTNVPNAYATPGGRLYLSRGMVALAENEAQIAAAIAHEIAHVEARHIARRIAEIERLVRNVANQAKSDLQSGASRTRRIAIIMQAVEERLGEIGGFSQQQELEADRIGLRLMTEAGYDPAALGTMLRRLDDAQRLTLARIGADESVLRRNNVSLYPAIDDRVASLGIEPVPAGEAATPESERLLAVTDGMAFDDVYLGGYIRDGSYWNPSRGFAFDVPEAALARHGATMDLITRDGVISLRFDAADIDAMEQRIRADAETFSDLRRIDIGGAQGLTAQSGAEAERHGFRGDHHDLSAGGGGGGPHHGGRTAERSGDARAL